MIAHNKNVVSSSPSSPATLSPTDHTPPISTTPVTNCHVKVHMADESSETPDADPSAEDCHHVPLLTMVHNSLNQPETSDIAQLLSVNKSTTHKDSRHIAKGHRQYVLARANKTAIQLIKRGANGGLANLTCMSSKKLPARLPLLALMTMNWQGFQLSLLQWFSRLNGAPLLASSMNVHTLNGFILRLINILRLL